LLFSSGGGCDSGQIMFETGCCNDINDNRICDMHEEGTVMPKTNAGQKSCDEIYNDCIDDCPNDPSGMGFASCQSMCQLERNDCKRG
ncbi:hypothetical protein KJ611_04685, partial [Patescibacteria group bacterium]|nr:hypothetical protein [Patescibacteria group bacterium]